MLLSLIKVLACECVTSWSFHIFQDVSNARKAEEEAALRKLDMLEKIEICTLMVMALAVFAALVFTLVYLIVLTD